MKRVMYGKRAAFFSIDAIIALGIILVAITLAVPVVRVSDYQSKLGEDILHSLETIKMGELDLDPVVHAEIISTMSANKSVLEQIGIYSIINQELAEDLANWVLADINPSNVNENLGLWYGDNLVWHVNSSNYESAENIRVDRRIISGYGNETGSALGYSARAFLVSALRTKYFYFGGYVGDGNLSFRLDYDGNLSNGLIELVINEKFNLYRNVTSTGNFSEVGKGYAASTDYFTPTKIPLRTYDLGTGTNYLHFYPNETGKNLFIAGGYIRLTYSTDDVVVDPENKKYFPGISGFTNLYDSFYSPGNLTAINMTLYVDTAGLNSFVTLGNKTIKTFNTTSMQEIFISQSDIEAHFDLDELSMRTIPLRVGFEGASYISEQTELDVFSVTDLSGSMNDCGMYADPLQCNYYCLWDPSNNPSCSVGSASQCDQTGENPCGGSCALNFWAGHYLTCESTLLDLAKDANKLFIESILNNAGSRVGLVGYGTNVQDSNGHNLSSDSASLNNKVGSWSAGGNTCICCGVNKAIQKLSEVNDPDKERVMLVMSDGIATTQCAQQGTGSASGDAIQAACDAKEDYNITVYTVSLGDEAQSDPDNTLEEMAQCGGGEYYHADIEEILDIYDDIAEEIIISFSNQTVNTAQSSLLTRISPDSHIEYYHTPVPQPIGIIISEEVTFANSTTGNFTISNGSTLIGARAVSYSGNKWTDKLDINGLSAYDLASYGDDYILLGDPYTVNIPNYLVNTSGINFVTLSSSSSPSDLNPVGSIHNKIHYTVAKSTSSSSGVSLTADGCAWNVTFYDDTSVNNLKIPTNYSGSNTCIYSPSNIIYGQNDAFSVAVYELFKQIDFNGDGKLDVKFTSNNLAIDLSELGGIPFTWGTGAEVRIWR